MGTGQTCYRCANLLCNSLKPLRPMVTQPVLLLQSTIRLVRFISQNLIQCTSLSYIWCGVGYMIRGSNPERRRDFSPIQNVQPYSGTHQAYSVFEGDSQSSQCYRLTIQPPSAEATNKWRYTSTLYPETTNFFPHKSRVRLKILDATRVT